MEKQPEYRTRARRKIMDYLTSQSDTTVRISDIMEHLNSIGEDVSFTTVYRYLTKLDREKKVIKFSGEGKTAVYQIVKSEHSCEEHIHIQCIRCGKLLHLDCDFMNDFRKHLLDRHDFRLRCEGSILYGICKDCAKKE